MIFINRTDWLEPRHPYILLLGLGQVGRQPFSHALNRYSLDAVYMRLNSSAPHIDAQTSYE